MSILLLPVGSDGQSFNDANGAPRSGAQLFVYLANTSTKATLYQNQSGATNHTNPIILNSSGQVANGSGSVKPIFIDSGSTYDVVLAPSNDTDPPASPYFTLEDISCINDVSTSVDLGSNDTITGNVSVSASSFNSIPGLSNITAAAIITLPAANTVIAGERRRFRTQTTGSVYLQTTGGDTINGWTTLRLSRYSIVEVYSDNISQWYVTDIARFSIEGTAVTAASDCDIWVEGENNTVHLTGTTTVTDWGTAPRAGASMWVICDAATPLTYHATTNDMNTNGANYTATAGDVLFVYARSASSYKITIYKYNGRSVTENLGWNFVETKTLSGAASTSFTGLAVNTRYRIDWALTHSTNEDLRLQFNSDTGAVYGWGHSTTDPITGGGASSGGGNVAHIRVSPQTAVAGNTEGEVTFTTTRDDTAQVHVWMHSVSEADASGTYDFDGINGHGAYNGSSNLSTAQLFVNTGTMTGTMTLWKLVVA